VSSRRAPGGTGLESKRRDRAILEVDPEKGTANPILPADSPDPIVDGRVIAHPHISAPEEYLIYYSVNSLDFKDL
jgi:hypothetical protein